MKVLVWDYAKTLQIIGLFECSLEPGEWANLGEGRFGVGLHKVVKTLRMKSRTGSGGANLGEIVLVWDYVKPLRNNLDSLVEV